MKKVLYLSNIEVPYRTRMFNLLAEHCELTVLYERERSDNRNSQWAKSEERKYQVEYLSGLKIGGENAFSFSILKHVFSGYDEIVIGCYNSRVQMLAILALRMMRKKYLLNIDGEVFLQEKCLKTAIKKFFLRGAAGYLAAGEKSAESIREIAGNSPVTVYYFSSLSRDELVEHDQQKAKRNNKILVVGQYFPYKGIDVAVQVARMDPEHSYLFVGMGKRTSEFVVEQQITELPNVEVIPFLQKNDLECLYRECAMLVLPSRQECWGLVVNEAASYGMPIVSTWGSGAAVEFLEEQYPQYLVKPDDAEALLAAILECIDQEDNEVYKEYLLTKAQEYSIEAGVKAHLSALKI